MPDCPPITIVNVGYLSTNYWVVSAGKSRLLVDLGYPGTMGTMQSRLNQMDIPLKEIRYALATHYHIDHAGLAQELKNAGVPLLVLDIQVAAILLMKKYTKLQDRYMEISLYGNVVISATDSRALLEKIGIPGEILHTPGHSDDSVSLLLDDGSVFTGDLTPLEHAWGEAGEVVKASWQLLKEKGAKRVYPAHGGIRTIPSSSDQGSQNGSSLY
jgi:glyoxylase-like metal-dependent hydrolase (beta-lactamase superfamily II)